MKALATLPRLTVELDGRPLTAGPGVLEELRVHQKLSQPALCELTFRAAAGELARSAPGTALRVAVDGHDTPLFDGEITASEHIYGPGAGRRLRLRGYDRLHRLRRRQDARLHVEVTPRELARELVAGLGLSVEGPEGPVWPRLIQHSRSDPELLAEVAESCGLYYTLRGDVLHLLTLEGLGEPLPLTLGDALLEARLEVNAAAACGKVSVAGWDALSSASCEGRAAGATAVAGRVAGGRGERYLAATAATCEDRAEALAGAVLERHQARAETLWGVAEGDPRLRPGSRIEIAGLADPARRAYVLTAVTHTLDARRGLLSEISSSPLPARLRPPRPIAAMGRVTRVDARGRLRAALPTYGGLETDWMEVVCAGAGSGKGLVVLPDVGDRVLVLLPHGDPAQGIVLGGLYGDSGPPDAGVEGGRVRRYALKTPGGHQLELDDEHRTLRLTDSSGSYLELSPGKLRIHAETDLEIGAPGHSVTIRGQAIDFERA